MPTLRRGDIFCTSNPMLLGKLILGVQRFHDLDNRADYSHAGLILSPKGTTFEALWTNRRANIFRSYAGKRVIIGRHRDMNLKSFAAGWDEVEHLEHRWYAGHRLFLHLIPPLAKYLRTGQFAVCSEIVAKFLCGAGFLSFWAGVNPDYLADMIVQQKPWRIVFEGKLPATWQELEAVSMEGPSHAVA